MCMCKGRVGAASSHPCFGRQHRKSAVLKPSRSSGGESAIVVKDTARTQQCAQHASDLAVIDKVGTVAVQGHVGRAGGDGAAKDGQRNAAAVGKNRAKSCLTAKELCAFFEQR